MKKRIAALCAMLLFFALCLPAHAAQTKPLSRFSPGKASDLASFAAPIDPLAPDSMLYFDQLGPISRDIYAALEAHAQEMMDGKTTVRFAFDASVSIGSVVIEDYADALSAFSRDHNEVFWIDYAKLGLDLEETESGGQTIVQGILAPLESSYLLAPFKTAAEVVRAHLALQEGLAKALACIDPSLGPAEQLRAAHDWLCAYNSYDDLDLSSDLRGHTALSALDSDESTRPVCEGYARAFKLLCGALSIPCMLVDGIGTVNGLSEQHMWNIVRLGGAWYAVDVTWDDNRIADDSGYAFFLVGRDTHGAGSRFSESHIPDPMISEDGRPFETHPLAKNRCGDPAENGRRKALKR